MTHEHDLSQLPSRSPAADHERAVTPGDDQTVAGGSSANASVSGEGMDSTASAQEQFADSRSERTSQTLVEGSQPAPHLQRRKPTNKKPRTAAPELPAPAAHGQEATARRLIYAQTKAGMFAADRIIFLYRPNIHTRQMWTITEQGVIAEPFGAPNRPLEATTPTATDAVDAVREGTQKPLNLSLVALKPDLTPATSEDDSALVTSAIEVAEHIEGPVAGRIVRILYRIANDPPFLRHPRITVDMNDLMDNLGYQRTARGYHDAQNRARVRDVLLALSRVEIRGERFDHKGGRELYSAPLITIRGGYYQDHETKDIAISELLERGLPSKLHIELGWYEGVRQATGELGNNYLLLPRDMSYFDKMSQADHARTEDLLAEFLWLRYSLQYRKGLTLSLTLDVALRRAGITNSNVTKARLTLEKALQKLVARGYIKAYSDLPVRRSHSFTVTLQLPNQHAKRQPGPPTLWDATTLSDPDTDNAVNAVGAGNRQQAHTGRTEDAGATSPHHGARGTTTHGTDGTPARDEAGNEAGNEADGEVGQVSPDPFSLAALAAEDGATHAASSANSVSGVGGAGESSQPTGSFLQVLRLGSYSLPAQVAWDRIRMTAQETLSPALYQHLLNVQPLWRADTLIDGDIEYWLHLGVPTGLRYRLESSVALLQEIADRFYPHAFGIMLGAPHVPSTAEGVDTDDTPV